MRDERMDELSISTTCVFGIEKDIVRDDLVCAHREYESHVDREGTDSLRESRLSRIRIRTPRVATRLAHSLFLSLTRSPTDIQEEKGATSS